MDSSVTSCQSSAHIETTAPKTFIKPKLVASHAADIQSQRKSYWDSLAPPTSDQLGPLQMQSNGFFDLFTMVFAGLFSWDQSGMISKIENIKSLTFASSFRITKYLKMQNIFVWKELIYILKSSRHLNWPASSSAWLIETCHSFCKDIGWIPTDAYK